MDNIQAMPGSSQETKDRVARMNRQNFLLKICFAIVIVATTLKTFYSGMHSTTSFMVFAISVLVFLVLGFVIYPFMVHNAGDDLRSAEYVPHPKSVFTYSIFGTGMKLLGCFGRGENVSYVFFCLFYMPVFPIGCYACFDKNCFFYKRTWSIREVVYLYIRQYSIAVIYLCAISILLN